MPTPSTPSSTALLLLLSLASAPPAAAQEGLPPPALRILERHRQAVGGDERIASLTTLRAHGVYHDDSVPYMPIVYTLRPPERSHFAVGTGRVVIVTSPEGGWSRGLDGTQVERPMATEHVLRHQRSADYTAMALLRYDPAELEYLGREKQDGRRVFAFQVELANGESAVFYLDARSSLLVKVEERWVLHGERLEIERSYDRFREVEGLVLPHFFAETNEQGTRTFQFRKIEINPDLDPALFAMPESAAPGFGSYRELDAAGTSERTSSRR